MSACWYCYWGWPKQVMDIYNRGIEEIGMHAMHFGPGHIVWEDENFEDHHIEWCLTEGQQYRDPDLSDEDLETLNQTLRDLLAVPREIRCCCPKNYDGYNPSRYPPPNGLIMERG